MGQRSESIMALNNRAQFQGILTLATIVAVVLCLAAVTHLIGFDLPDATISNLDESERGPIDSISINGNDFEVGFEPSDVRQINVIGPDGDIVASSEISVGQTSADLYTGYGILGKGQYTVLAIGKDREVLGEVVVNVTHE